MTYHRPRGYCAACHSATGPHHGTTARHKRATGRQYTLGLFPAPRDPGGYCSPCGREYRDIIEHRGAQDHRRRNYRAPGPINTGRPGWMIAVRADPDDQYTNRWPDYAPVDKRP